MSVDHASAVAVPKSDPVFLRVKAGMTVIVTDTEGAWRMADVIWVDGGARNQARLGGMEALPQTLFCRPAEVVGPELVGCRLVKRQDDSSLLWGVICLLYTSPSPRDRG